MVKKSLINVISGIIGILFSPYIYAATNIYNYTCPEIAVTQTASLNNLPWKIVSDKGIESYVLHRVGFFSGYPQERAELVPESNDLKQKQISVWEFSKDEKAWLACYYRNTQVIAMQKLPKNVRKCELTAQLLPTGSEITGRPVTSTQRITCQ